MINQKAHDAGKAIYSILFGVVFGLSVSAILPFNQRINSKDNSGYNSSIIALIGKYCKIKLFYQS